MNKETEMLATVTEAIAILNRAYQIAEANKFIYARGELERAESQLQSLVNIYAPKKVK